MQCAGNANANISFQANEILSKFYFCDTPEQDQRAWEQQSEWPD